MTDMELAQSVLAHHGIKGQKWGIRRFQNPDGSLTEEGKKRYGSKQVLEARKTVAKLGVSYSAFLLGLYGLAKLDSKVTNELVDLYKNTAERLVNSSSVEDVYAGIDLFTRATFRDFSVKEKAQQLAYDVMRKGV